jgi:hypothetical protein
MTPLPPALPPAALAPADPHTRAPSAQSDQPAVALPALGAAAVTAATATKPVSTRRDPQGNSAAPGGRGEIEPLEPPKDPPPVKGLGIPPLHTAKVGDRDRAFAMPQSNDLAATLAETDAQPARQVDLRR